jgi:hypothetical protein
VRFYDYEVNYAGRQVDIELLQSISRPAKIQQVSLSTVNDTPKIVAGIQKLAQRYALLLLFRLGDTPFDTEQGTSLLAAVVSGTLINMGQVYHHFALANMSVRQNMASDDKNTDTFGAVPDDERLARARLIDASIDFGASTLSLTIRLTTKAGSTITFIVPVTAAR